MKLHEFFSRKPLYIDLGSANTRVFSGDAQVFNEATCIAVHRSTSSIVAFGNKALKLLGKNPNTIEVSFPIQQGSVSDTRYLELYLTAVLDTIFPDINFKRFLFGLSLKIAIPSVLAPAKQKLLHRILKRVGFTQIEFVSSGYAIARNSIGEQLLTKDICILDIGAQKTEISVFSLGELIHAQLFNWGGVMMTETLQNVVRQKHSCILGWHLAETAKLDLGTLESNKSKLAVRGKDIISQSAKTILISASEVQHEFLNQVEELCDQIQQFIALLPSEIAISVLEKGIYLTGGVSQLKGIDSVLIERFKCDVLLSTNPQLDVVQGLKKS